MTVLDRLEFAPVLITDVFNVARQAPSWMNTNQVRDGQPKHPHVTNTSLKNSVAGFIAPQSTSPNPGRAITIGIDTQVVAYQPVAFYGATKVLELRAGRLDEKNAMVLVTALRRAVEKFSWGHKASARRLTRTRIMVPVLADADGKQIIDWDGMTGLGEELLAQARVDAQKASLTRPDEDDALPDLTFEPMLITEVFETMKSSSAWYDKSKLTMTGSATYPFVSRTRASNGIDGFCPRQEKAPESGGAITIGLDTQTVGYQPVPFYTGQNIQVLRHSCLNDFSATALTSLVQAQMSKFSWGGNGATLGRLRKTRIMVPVTTDADGKQAVDWDGMTAYGRALRVRAERRMSGVLELQE